MDSHTFLVGKPSLSYHTRFWLRVSQIMPHVANALAYVSFVPGVVADIVCTASSWLVPLLSHSRSPDISALLVRIDSLKMFVKALVPVVSSSAIERRVSGVQSAGLRQ